MIQNIPYKFNPFPVYKAASQPVIENSLTFTGKSATNAVQLSAVGNPDAITLQYSKNGGAWTNYTIGDIIELSSNETLSLYGANDHFSKDYSNCYRFQMTGTIEANGNIQSLMNFSNSCTDYCYMTLFSGCASLTTPPQLPATGLANGCYQWMFWWCTSLINSPVLSATTLADYCYASMFEYCTALTDAPTLPATTLVEGCYIAMFKGCSSLYNGPYLPATTLATACYQEMFRYCGSLTSISCNFTSWNVSYSTTNWVQGIASNGTFYCPTGLDTTTTGNSNVPTNWTVINT